MAQTDNIIVDKTKLKVSQFTGTAAAVQTAFRAAIANNDWIISCDTSRKKDSNYIVLTVVWYDVA